MLSSCGNRDWMDTLTKSKPQSNNVAVGERRAPVLNPQAAVPGSAPAPVMQSAPAPKQTPAKAPSYDVSPYDHFDAEGNRVDPQAALAAQQAPDSSSGNFFDRMVNTFKKPEAQATETSKPQPQQVPRKMFPGNSYVSGETHETAPISATPQPVPAVEKEAEEIKPQSSVQPMLDAPAPAAPEPQQTAAAEPEAVTEIISDKPQPSFFERTWNSVKAPFSDDKDAPAETESAAASNADSSLEYPALSSVPQTPEQFTSIKAGHKNKVEQMQDEHALAAQEKIALDSEPSQQQLLPVADAQPAPEPEIAAAPAPEPQTAAAPQDAAPVSEDNTVLLGHAMAPEKLTNGNFVTKSEQFSQAEAEAAPAAAVEEAAAPETAAAATRQPYWWEGWSVLKKKPAPASAPEEAAPAAVMAQEPAQASEPAPAQQATAPEPAYSSQPVPLTAAAEEETPLEESQPQQAAAPVTAPEPAPLAALPSLTPSAAPVTAVAASDEREETANAAPAQDSALPSPAMLQKVRIMPSSRYSQRVRTQ